MLAVVGNNGFKLESWNHVSDGSKNVDWLSRLEPKLIQFCASNDFVEYRFEFLEIFNAFLPLLGALFLGAQSLSRPPL